MTVEQVSNRQEQIASIIRRAAQNTDQDFNYLLTQARVESGLNPNASAKTSSATGLYQFTSGTWIDLVKRHGDKVGLDGDAQALRNGSATPDVKSSLLSRRTDPRLSAEMAARFAIDNAQALSRSGHQNLGSTELYLAHFLGPKGADVFLTGLKKSPNAPAAQALPQAAQANVPVFYNRGAPRSFSEIFSQFQRKFEGSPATTPAATPAAPSVVAAAPGAAIARAVTPRASSPSPDVAAPGGRAAKVAPLSAPKPSSAPAAPKAAEPQLEAVKMDAAPADMGRVAANALREASQETGVPVSDMPLDAAALGSFLRNFDLQKTDPALAPIINDSETRDASSGAGVGWSETAEFDLNLSGHAIGGRLLVKAADPRDAGAPGNAIEDEPRSAPVAGARATYADYASLWGGASKAAPSQPSK